MKLSPCFLVVFVIGAYAVDDTDPLHQTLTDIITTSEAPGNTLTHIRGQSTSLLTNVCQQQSEAEAVLRVSEASLGLQKCALSVTVQYSKNANPSLDDLQVMCLSLNTYSQTCVPPFVEQISACMPNNAEFLKSTMKNITNTVVNFVCDANARNARQFIKEKGEECIRYKQATFGKCVTDFLDDLSNNSETADAVAKATSANQFTLSECKTYHKLYKCAVNEVATCSSSIPATLFEKVYKNVVSLSSCDQYSACQVDPECDSESRWSPFFTKNNM